MSGTEKAAALRGVDVIATRPSHQAKGLTQRLESLGATVVEIPALEIAFASPSALTLARARAARAEIVIFVSRNAVDAFYDDAHEVRLRGPVCAVGASTAAALGALGVVADEAPQNTDPDLPHSTEALLMLPRLQSAEVAGCRIVIVRGVGGRPTLGNALRDRGAEVEYAEVYERQRPVLARSVLGGLVGSDSWVIVITSVEGFDNFCAMCLESIPGCMTERWLSRCAYLVLSERIAHWVTRRWPQSRVYAASQASDEGVVKALLANARDMLEGDARC